ncbi:MAG: hypothetical protein J5934_03825 [Succinivibrio sp.]|nr:hypothetical protein [Succinivibrio sp.]
MLNIVDTERYAGKAALLMSRISQKFTCYWHLPNWSNNSQSVEENAICDSICICIGYA